MVGLERQRESAEVGDVLAHGEIAVHMHASERLELRILCPEALGACLELRRIVLRPPVAKRAGSIDLPALIVEAVRHLVTDHPTDGPVVDGWIGIDRKSTRLNSSHSQISYAVFCLK